MDTAKRTKRKMWSGFEFVLSVQREDFVSVVWVLAGLREGKDLGIYLRADTRHTNHRSEQAPPAGELSTKRMRREERIRGETETRTKRE